MGSSSSDGGLSVKTLLISGLSAAGATLIVPLIWEPGTVIATAATPIIVAVFKKTLRRPADRVSQAPAIGLRRRRRPRTSATAGTRADDARHDAYTDNNDAYTDNNDAYTHHDYARPMTFENGSLSRLSNLRVGADLGAVLVVVSCLQDTGRALGRVARAAPGRSVTEFD